MSFEPREYLRHILVEAQYLLERSRGLEKAGFVAEGMVRVTTFLRETVVYLSERDQPLTKAGEAPAPAGGESRKVSLGTMRDFAFEGPGVLVQSVIEGSPAAKAGIQAGVLLALDATELKTLRDLSDALKAHASGDIVKLRLRRGAEEVRVEATLVAR